MVSVGDKGTAAWANGRPPGISGSVTITVVSSGVAVSAAVSFPVGLFTVKPMVVTGCETGAPGAVATSASGISTTGCTVWLSKTAGIGSASIVDWIAVGT